MAKKGTKIQIVDLGSHYLKAAVCEVGDGTFPVVKAAAVPMQGAASEGDAFMAEATAAFDSVADVFDRKTPIHFIANETLIRVGVAYLNNVTPEGAEESLVNERQKFISSFGTAAYEQPIARSFRLREKQQGKNQQIVAAHTYAKLEHLEGLQAACSGKKLTFGGVYPRLFAYNELYRLAFGSDPARASSVACLVDIGFRSTGVVALKDGNIVFHKVLHLGAFDLYKELHDIEPKLALDLPSFALIMANSGFQETPDSLTSLGLPIGNPDRYVEAILSATDQVFTKIQLSIDYFSTVAATDFNTSMSTVMAVRKGPELVAFMGGLSCCPMFPELAAKYFGDGGVVLDTSGIAPMSAASQKNELPPSAFALAAAGAALVASDAGATYNLGDEVKSSRSGSRSSAAGASAGAGASGGQSVPVWAVLLFLLVMGGLGYYWWMLRESTRKLQAELAEKTAAVEESFNVIQAYKNVADRQMDARLRLDLISEMAKHRVPWPRFFEEVQGAIPEGLKVFRISVETALPDSGSDQASAFTPKTVTFKMCGESLQRDSVNELISNLEKTKRFVKIASPETVLAGEGTGSPSGPCNDPDATGLVFKKHFAFQIQGQLAY